MRLFLLHPVTSYPPESAANDQRFATTPPESLFGFEAVQRADGRSVLAAWLLFAILIAPPVLSLFVTEATGHLF
jgi:hypothetical protein